MMALRLVLWVTALVALLAGSGALAHRYQPIGLAIPGALEPGGRVVATDPTGRYAAVLYGTEAAEARIAVYEDRQLSAVAPAPSGAPTLVAIEPGGAHLLVQDLSGAVRRVDIAGARRAHAWLAPLVWATHAAAAPWASGEAG